MVRGLSRSGLKRNFVPKTGPIILHIKKIKKREREREREREKRRRQPIGACMIREQVREVSCPIDITETRGIAAHRFFFVFFKN